MQPIRSMFACLLLAALSACGEPRCPRNYEKRGDTCYRIRPDAGDLSKAADGGEPSTVADADSEPSSDCYLDWDHDGFGTGDSVDCALDVDVLYPETRTGTAAPSLVERTGDCDDENPERAPELAEVCDGIDNDCDDDVDDGAENECGGPCSQVLDHPLGDPCSNGLAGACAREGKYVCDGARAVRCDAVMVAPSQELCGDQADNDCDGQTDEADGIDAPFWYQDCDGDGYAPSATGAVRSCAKPSPRGTCSWTAVLPQPETKTNWDCDDSRAVYSPEADYALPQQGSNNYDLNCDGRTEPDPAPDFASATRPCPPSVVRFLNGEAVLCNESTLGRGRCYVWKTSSGSYARPNPAESTQLVQLCPDAPVEVYVELTPWDDPKCVARNSASSPVWPCR